MLTSLRWSYRCVLLLLACNIACNDDCDETCNSDYDHCVSKAKDSDQRARCDAERDQCRGICASQPPDTGQRR